MNTRKLLLAAAFAAALPTAGHAMDNVIEARRGYYDLVALNFGGVVAMARGAKPYSADDAAVYTQNLKALAGLNLGPLFAKGSDNFEHAGKTRALPAIWENFSDVATLANNFKAAVEKLDAAAAKDLNSLRAAVGAVGETCKACHTKYRAKEF